MVGHPESRSTDAPGPSAPVTDWKHSSEAGADTADAQEERRVRARWATTAAAGFSVEAALGGIAAAIALAGIGGIAPVPSASATVVVVAFGLLVASRFRGFAVRARTRETGMAEVGALSSEYLAGGPALILGILAATGTVPHILIAVATLLYGIVWMFGGTEAARQASISTLYPPPFPPDPRTLRMLQGAAGLQMMAGIAAVILAIMFLVGPRPLAMLLVALLGLSVSKALGAAAVAWRMRTAW